MSTTPTTGTGGPVQAFPQAMDVGHSASAASAAPAAAAAAAAGAAQARPALLPNPADTLARAQQRFPDVPVGVLRGEDPFSSTPTAVMDLVEQIRTGAPREGQVPILVGADSSSRIAYMPTKGVAGPNAAEKIQTYVLKGKAIFDQIMANAFPQQPSKHDVTHVMWFLQALGSAKASESSGNVPGAGGMLAPAKFAEGAFSVEDPEGYLQDFLQRANSYDRSSSHLHEYQALGPEFAPHGVDVRNTETPNGRKTVLFARMPRDHEVPAGGPPGTGTRRMLFIKIEPHGCRGLTPKGSGTPRDPGVRPSRWKGFKRFFLNAKDLIMHGAGFLRSVGQRLGLVAVEGQNNRERIPADVKDVWRRGMEQVREQTSLAAVRAALEQGNPLSDGNGIKKMLANLAAARQAFNNLPVEVRTASEQVGKYLATLENMLRRHGDHPELRIGNEIILTRDEMNVGAAVPVKSWEPGVHAREQFEMSAEMQEIMVAGMSYRLDNIDADGTDAFFIQDANRMVYTIGPEGTAQVFNGQSALARQAVLDMTGGDERTALALMTFANQKLMADITASLLSNAMIATGLMLYPGGASEYSIARLADEPVGVQRYVVAAETTTRGYSCPLVGGGFHTFNPDELRITTQTRVMITVSPDGVMTPSLVRPPSYSYVITPA